MITTIYLFIKALIEEKAKYIRNVGIYGIDTITDRTLPMVLIEYLPMRIGSLLNNVQETYTSVRLHIYLSVLNSTLNKDKMLGSTIDKLNLIQQLYKDLDVSIPMSYNTDDGLGIVSNISRTGLQLVNGNIKDTIEIVMEFSMKVMDYSNSDLYGMKDDYIIVPNVEYDKSI